MASNDRKSRPIWVISLLLGYLIPGAGHLYLGRAVRGGVIFLTITATFWAGVAIGGVNTLEPRYEGWWFMGQMLTGVNGLVAWRLHEKAYDQLERKLQEDQQYLSERRRHGGRDLLAVRRPYLDRIEAKQGIALVAPTETVARAYSGVAGLLNLLCIFDAVILSLMNVTGEPARGSPQPQPRGI